VIHSEVIYVVTQLKNGILLSIIGARNTRDEAERLIKQQCKGDYQMFATLLNTTIKDIY